VRRPIRGTHSKESSQGVGVGGRLIRGTDSQESSQEVGVCGGLSGAQKVKSQARGRSVRRPIRGTEIKSQARERSVREASQGHRK